MFCLYKCKQYVNLENMKLSMDCIEYDVTRLKYQTYKMVSVRVRACVYVP